MAPAEGGGLPSWAQRHLGEAGEADETLTVATPSPLRHRRRAAAPEPAHRLKGWGVAVVSVAAAVGAVPLAISSVAADRSDDPLPTVNTFTAGAPGPLESGGAQSGMTRGGGTRTVPGDPSTGGILDGPAGVPGAPGVPGAGPAVAGPAVPVPQPAAVVRPTLPAPTSTTTAPARPLAGTSTTAPKPTPTTTGGDDDGDDDTPRTAPKPSAPSKPPASSSGSSGGDSSPGLVGGLVNTTGKVVGGAGKVVGGLL